MNEITMVRYTPRCSLLVL